MPSPIRVAQYVRMSTEHQQYSTENQAAAIAQYAESHQMEVVRTYADHGKSGLNLFGRSSLRALLADVQTGEIDYSAVLVYDVSRWGRFQDADESAYYEYVLKQAGVRVHYCAEPFENDGSLPSSLIKTLKRTMAGEYSRELSVKVFAGHCRLSELGFRQGSVAGYGLSRHLVDQHRNFKQILRDGERKSIQTDRVVLAPGPPEEVAVVRRIFQDFTVREQNEPAIAKALNSEGLLRQSGGKWSRFTIRQVLTNPKYIGENLYNRTSFKLKRKRVKNPPEMWIVRPGAFEPIVDRSTYERALQIIAGRHRHLSDEELLQQLRTLLARVGRLSGFIIDEAEEMPSAFAYTTRFGNLARAYSLIGWNPGRDFSYIEINRKLRAKHQHQLATVIDQLTAEGATVVRDAVSHILTVNGEFTVSVVLSRCRTSDAGNHRWVVRFDRHLKTDITIAARLTANNEEVLDYYVLPKMADLGAEIRLGNHNPLSLEIFRFDDLSFFFHVAKRVAVQEAA